MERAILVPLDGSVFGEHALPIAVGIARRTGATLHLVHVHAFDLSALADLPGDQPLDEAIQESERAYLASVVQRVAAIWDGSVITVLRDGIIATALHDYALAQQVDLVVLTSHGRGGIARAWLGNTADTLVRTLPIPVLLVRPLHEAVDLADVPSIQHILVPLDGSPLAEQVLGPALALSAGTLTTLTLLHTVEPLVLSYMTLDYSGTIQRVQQDAEAVAQTYLERVAEQIRRPGLLVITHVEVGPPAPSTLHYAETHNVDLIALATHGRRGLARLALGSIADKVSRSASLPVLIYRPVHQAEHADAKHTDVLEHIA
jgi:nucleotide-binding universal stress UspA family protein